MKRVLITGKNSYIGVSLKDYLTNRDYIVSELDVHDQSWKSIDFSRYDIVINVAGIAHIKQTKRNTELYYKVNRDLAIEIARKAKEDGVKQFILFSSISVFGKDAGVISNTTIPSPNTAYGKSKLEADEIITKLNNDAFKVCIVRPPMVYGKNCKGNFQTLLEILKKTNIFPEIKNKRSVIHIDNLSNFIYGIIENECKGTFYPQNQEYFCTSQAVRIISKVIHKKIYFSRILGLVIEFTMLFSKKTRKAFGDLIIEDIDDYKYEYCIIKTKESIEKSI